MGTRPPNGTWLFYSCPAEGSNSPLLSRHQLPIVPHLGMGDWESLLHLCLNTDRLDLLQALCKYLELFRDDVYIIHTIPRRQIHTTPPSFLALTFFLPISL